MNNICVECLMVNAIQNKLLSKEVVYQSSTDVDEVCIFNRFCIFEKQRKIFSQDVAKHNFIGF